jgi:hypothetical protein
MTAIRFLLAVMLSALAWIAFVVVLYGVIG